jgi:ATP-dependent exoDNAse (exonuclease V) beta subunit
LVRLEHLLRPPSGRSRDEGILVHAWLETIGWVEEGIPSRTDLIAIAEEKAPALSHIEPLIASFQEWISRPKVAALLARESFPPGTMAEREVPFLARDGARLLQGVVDRLVRIPEAGGPRTLVIDWKTDLLDPSDPQALDARTAHYRPQVEGYLRAMAAGENLPQDKVEAFLVFLRAGVVRKIVLP